MEIQWGNADCQLLFHLLAIFTYCRPKNNTSNTQFTSSWGDWLAAVFPTQPHPVYPSETIFYLPVTDSCSCPLTFYLCGVFILSLKHLFIVIILLVINGVWCCKDSSLVATVATQEPFAAFSKSKGAAHSHWEAEYTIRAPLPRKKPRVENSAATASVSELLRFKLIYIPTFCNPLPALEYLCKSRREGYKSHSTCFTWQIGFWNWRNVIDMYLFPFGYSEVRARYFN